MTFLASKLFLGWLAAAVLPLVVYWLYRRRKTVVEWSANYILRLTLRREGKNRLWKVITILALRVLVLLLIVLALARPLWERPPAADTLPHGEGSLHQVILVDNSRSMCLRYHSFTRDDEMRSRLETLLGRMRHGDQCELIPLAVPEGTRPAVLRVRCPASPTEIANVLDSLRLVERPAAVADGLQLAAERFHVTSANQRQLLWLGDLSSKDVPDLEPFQTLKRELAALNVKSVIYEIRDRENERPNLAIADFRAGATAMFSGWKYHLYVALRNYGSASLQSAVTVQVRQGERVLDTQSLPLDMKPQEQRLFDFPFLAPNGVDGLVSLRVSVTDDSYPWDNAREFAVALRPSARVLLVVHPAEEEMARPLWRDSRYLETALSALGRKAADAAAPAKVGRGATLVRDPNTGQLVAGEVAVKAGPQGADARPAMRMLFERLKPDELTPDKVAAADAVVFFGVSRVEPPVRDALLRLVAHGGGVLFGMADSIIADEFNDCFAGLAPLPLAESYAPLQRDRADWDYDAPHRQIEKTFEHPLLRRYLDEAEGSIEHVRVYNYFRVRGDGEPLMTLNNGDPLLLECAVGRGRVLMLTSSLGGQWNTLPVRNMYVNLVYAWLTHLCSFRGLDRNLTRGDPLIVDAPGTPKLMVATPAGGAAVGPLPVRVVDGQPYVRFDGLREGGEYRVFQAGTEEQRFLVQESLFESDTRGFSPEERTTLAASIGGQAVDQWARVGAALGAEAHAGVELLGPLVLLLMLVLLADVILTRIWFR